MSDKPILVCTSVNDIKAARNIANELLTKKYSPCINIVSNNESIYVWNNDIETTNEYILFIKSVKSKFKNIEKLILTMHPYEIHSPGRTRTADLVINSHSLYQLSYRGISSE